MKENLYGLLVQFSHGTTPSETHLMRHYSKDLIEYAIENGYIVQVGKNTYGDSIYTITENGKNIRDGKGE